MKAKKRLAAFDLFETSSRINRTKFFLLNVFWLLLSLFFILAHAALHSVSLILFEALTMLFAAPLVLILFINLIMLRIRRIRDFNCSGWLVLLSFIPIVNVVWFLVMCLIPGSQGNNKYGPQPTFEQQQGQYSVLVYSILILFGGTIFFTFLGKAIS